MLASAYQTALELADSHDCRFIALPALSTGAYRYPLEPAAAVAVHTAAKFLQGVAGDRPLAVL